MADQQQKTKRIRRSIEEIILDYFETAPYSSARTMLNIVSSKMRKRSKEGNKEAGFFMTAEEQKATEQDDDMVKAQKWLNSEPEVGIQFDENDPRIPKL